MKRHDWNGMVKKLLPVLIPGAAAIVFYAFADMIEGLESLAEASYRAGYAFGTILEQIF